MGRICFGRRGLTDIRLLSHLIDLLTCWGNAGNECKWLSRPFSFLTLVSHFGWSVGSLVGWLVQQACPTTVGYVPRGARHPHAVQRASRGNLHRSTADSVGASPYIHFVVVVHLFLVSTHESVGEWVEKGLRINRGRVSSVIKKKNTIWRPLMGSEQ